MSGPGERVAAVLAEHYWADTRGDSGDPEGKWWQCRCGYEENIAGMSGWWSWRGAHDAHVADVILAAIETARTDAEGLCSQCGELPRAMVKVGTDDGWCTDCLDRAAATPEAAVKALLWAADEMSAVIADGDVAEVAAYVPGEVGRATCVERRGFLLEDPVDWLRAYAAALDPEATHP